jgi:hypothetical protein
MMRKFIIITIIILAFVFPVKADLSKDAIESIGRFLVMDFITAESPKHRKPLTPFFYVKIGDGVATVSKGAISVVNKWINEGDFKPVVLHRDTHKPKETEYVGSIDIADGEYREIVIINEVSGIGLLERSALINIRNQVFWLETTYSLHNLAFKADMGNMMLGVKPMMLYRKKKRGRGYTFDNIATTAVIPLAAVPFLIKDCAELL